MAGGGVDGLGIGGGHFLLHLLDALAVALIKLAQVGQIPAFAVVGSHGGVAVLVGD